MSPTIKIFTNGFSVKILDGINYIDFQLRSHAKKDNPKID